MLNIDPNSRLGRWLKKGLIGFAGLIVVLGVFVYFARGWKDKQGGDNNVKTKVRLEALELSLKSRHFMKGAYPTTDEGLAALFKRPKAPKFLLSLESMIDGKPTQDAWKNEFRYVCPGEQNLDSFDLWSVGEDGKDGTADDITNWSNGAEEDLPQ